MVPKTPVACAGVMEAGNHVRIQDAPPLQQSLLSSVSATAIGARIRIARRLPRLLLISVRDMENTATSTHASMKVDAITGLSVETASAWLTGEGRGARTRIVIMVLPLLRSSANVTEAV